MNDSGLAGGRPTWAEIDLDALAWNFRAVRERVGPGVKVMGVVKADAYGHGAAECARRLEAEGADWFAVATPEEGLALRRAGLTRPVLCFGGFWEGQGEACVAEGLVPVVYRLDMAEAFDAAARAVGVVADVHVKIDTGMGRLGVRYDEAAEFAEHLRRFRGIRVDGLMTHFAAADEPRRCPRAAWARCRRVACSGRTRPAARPRSGRRRPGRGTAAHGRPSAGRTRCRWPAERSDLAERATGATARRRPAGSSACPCR